jgi:hypothetical protein
MNTRQGMNAHPVTARKAAFFENFWQGRGPYPILFAKPHIGKGKPWLLHSIAAQHADPQACLEEALTVAEYTMMDIDDGIPVARADLGVTLFPGFAGLAFCVADDTHPWPAEHWPLASYAAMPDIAATVGLRDGRGELPAALAVYRLLLERVDAGLLPLPYVPDNQGVFDISHIIVGTDWFYGLMDDPAAVHAAQENSLSLYLAGTSLFKSVLGEERNSMLHGHGMPSGVWFPDVGARISEDSCTLVSDEAIREYCIPYLERAAAAFGGLFMHYCGYHEGFFNACMGQAWARVLNLGNPESYDLDDVLMRCGKGRTVYFGALQPDQDEDDDSYLERMAELAGRNASGLILVAPPLPSSAPDDGHAGSEVIFYEQRCRRMRDRWHGLTAGFRFKR